MDTETSTPPNPPPTPKYPHTGSGPDFNGIMARAKAILLTPKTEWPVIAAEPASVAGLYKSWICVMAAIPAVFGFIKGSIIGYSMFGASMKVPFMTGISGMILTYVATLGIVYVVALVIDALAPNFAVADRDIRGRCLRYSRSRRDCVGCNEMATTATQFRV